MDSLIQVVVSGLTIGAMYAISAIGLALIWGVLHMLNMAHGTLLVIGGYTSFVAVNMLGLPWYLGLPASIVGGITSGAIIFYVIVRWLYRHQSFEIGIIIATVGVAIVVENLLVKAFSAYPKRQPFFVDGGFRISEILVPHQTLIIIAVAVVLVVALAWLILRTGMGRAIRATTQSPEAARLMGVPVGRVYLQVLLIGGAVAAISGVCLTSIVPLAPHVGGTPMLKAFIVCVIAGLGNLPGTVLAGIVLGLFESAVEYGAGARYGFPAMLALVIIVLIWRPYGVFGRADATRV